MAEALLEPATRQPGWFHYVQQQQQEQNGPKQRLLAFQFVPFDEVAAADSIAQERIERTLEALDWENFVFQVHLLLSEARLKIDTCPAVLLARQSDQTEHERQEQEIEHWFKQRGQSVMLDVVRLPEQELWRRLVSNKELMSVKLQFIRELLAFVKTVRHFDQDTCVSQASDKYRALQEDFTAQQASLDNGTAKVMELEDRLHEADSETSSLRFQLEDRTAEVEALNVKLFRVQGREQLQRVDGQAESMRRLAHLETERDALRLENQVLRQTNDALKQALTESRTCAAVGSNSIASVATDQPSTVGLAKSVTADESPTLPDSPSHSYEDW